MIKIRTTIMTMNTRLYLTMSLKLGGSALALVLTGCATTTFDKSQATASNLQTAAADVQAEERALDLTLVALNDLVNKPPVDLRIQFDLFSNNLDQLIKTARLNDLAAQRITASSASY